MGYFIQHFLIYHSKLEQKSLETEKRKYWLWYIMI